jgi:hypothetical protein
VIMIVTVPMRIRFGATACRCLKGSLDLHIQVRPHEGVPLGAGGDEAIAAHGHGREAALERVHRHAQVQRQSEEHIAGDAAPGFETENVRHGYFLAKSDA